MEATGRVVAISEPLCPDRIVNMYQTRGDSPQLRQLTRDVIRLECRPYKSLHPEPLAYMMKLVAPSGVGLPFFRWVNKLGFVCMLNDILFKILDDVTPCLLILHHHLTAATVREHSH